MTFSFGRFNVILKLSNGVSTLGEVYCQIGESLCHVRYRGISGVSNSSPCIGIECF